MNFIRLIDARLHAESFKNMYLGTRIAGIDTVGFRARVPFVDGRIELHARIATHMRTFGDQTHQVASVVAVDHTIWIGHRPRLPLSVVQDGTHEVVGHANAVIGVLEENRGVGRSGKRPVVAGVDQCPGFLLFFRLVDEFDDVRMVGIEDDHLRGAPRLAARLDHAGERVVALHERHRTGGGAAAARSSFEERIGDRFVPVRSRT